MGKVEKVEKKCSECPANIEMWRWKLSFTGGSECPTETCKLPKEQTCSMCMIHMSMRAEFKLSQKRCGKPPKLVKCVEADKVYASISQASKVVGCRHSAISNVLDKPNRAVFGQHWITWDCKRCANASESL